MAPPMPSLAAMEKGRLSSNGTDAPAPQKRKQSHLFPLVFCILLVVSCVNFVHSVHVLHDHAPPQEGSVTSALADFKRPSNHNQPSPPPVTTTSSSSSTLDELDVHEDPLPNPPMSSGNETFGACLLVMDDNHRLVEWLAYHYHVLPLRHLIVAVDPRSRTSPTAVLNRWRSMGVYIEEWNDFVYMKQEIAKNVMPDDAELHIKRDRHRIRQRNFYQQCLKTSRLQNRTWVTLTDTDEFLMYNHKGGPDFDQWEAAQQVKHEASKFAHKERLKPSMAPPTPKEAGGLLPYLHHEQAAGTPHFQRKCISCPRLQFGAKESMMPDEQRTKGVPEGIVADRLDTLRFRHHAFRNDFVKNGLSKSIVDVSRIEKFPRIQSLHRPIKTECTAPWKDEWNSGLRIYHYLGSWEAYSYRDDSRRGGERSYEGWVFKAQDADETDDNIRPWVEGFVATHGIQKAQSLLQGAGLPRGYNAAGAKNWTIQFLDKILNDTETQGNDVRVAFDNFVRDFHFHRNQSIDGLI